MDSMNLDPLLIVDFQGATQNQVALDDDSGGGIFGINAQIIYRAPHSGSFRIVVREANDRLGQFGGYFLSVSEAAPGAIPAVIAEPPTIVDSPFGPMAVYESARYPFSVQHVSGWTQQPLDPQITTKLSLFSDQGDSFGILEEDLIGLGLQRTSLDEYTDLIIPDYRISDHRI